MITILAEKPDVGNKIAAALDRITLDGGKEVTFSGLKANERAVKAQQTRDGYLKIRYEGQDCVVTWGFGHLGQLKEAKDYDPKYRSWYRIPRPFIPEKYELKPRESGGSFDKRTKDQLKLIKKAFDKSDLIINATDFDREGEVIFSYIYELCGCTKPVERVCFASQTKEGITEAFAARKKRSEVASVEAAGRMRGIADWVAGINLTVAMTLKARAKGNVLSVGRVQTPTLKMLVDREKAVRAFKPEKYWTVEAEFTTADGGTYKGQHTGKRFTEKAAAEAVMERIRGGDGTVASVAEKTEEKLPPQLYSLAALQMDANAKYGMTLKETLDAAQALYDGGYTTYPRTDSRYLTEDMAPTVHRVLDSLAKDPEYAPLIEGRERKFAWGRYFNDRKVESHYAIIPTTSRPKNLSGHQAKVYDLIARSVVCMLYGKAVLVKTNVTTDVRGEAFSSSGTRVAEPGYMAVTGRDRETELPALTVGQTVSGAYEMKEKETEPPKRFTDKTLLAAMIGAGKELEDEELRKILEDPDVAGIGTPATRDAIIERLISVGYAERKGKTLCATDRGISLIDALPVEAVKSPALTAVWEKRLHGIERGTEDADAFRRDIEKTVGDWVGEVWAADPGLMHTDPVKPETPVPCPVCGKPMWLYPWGWGCSGYDVKEKTGCRFGVGEKCGRILTEDEVRKLIAERDTGLLTGFRSAKTKKPFKAHLVLDAENKVQFQFEDREPKAEKARDETAEPVRPETPVPCPKCGKPMWLYPWGWTCGAEDGCGFEVGEMCGKMLSEDEIRRLVTEKDTGLLEGFTSRRSGKPFDAHLVLDKNGKVRYRFEDRAPKEGAKKAAKAAGEKAAKAPAKRGNGSSKAGPKAAKGTAASGSKKSGTEPKDGE